MPPTKRRTEALPGPPSIQYGDRDFLEIPEKLFLTSDTWRLAHVGPSDTRTLFYEDPVRGQLTISRKQETSLLLRKGPKGWSAAYRFDREWRTHVVRHPPFLNQWFRLVNESDHAEYTEVSLNGGTSSDVYAETIVAETIDPSWSDTHTDLIRWNKRPVRGLTLLLGTLKARQAATAAAVWDYHELQRIDRFGKAVVERVVLKLPRHRLGTGFRVRTRPSWEMSDDERRAVSERGLPHLGKITADDVVVPVYEAAHPAWICSSSDQVSTRYKEHAKAEPH